MKISEVVKLAYNWMIKEKDPVYLRNYLYHIKQAEKCPDLDILVEGSGSVVKGDLY